MRSARLAVGRGGVPGGKKNEHGKRYGAPMTMMIMLMIRVMVMVMMIASAMAMAMR